MVVYSSVLRMNNSSSLAKHLEFPISCCCQQYSDGYLMYVNIYPHPNIYPNPKGANPQNRGLHVDLLGQRLQAFSGCANIRPKLHSISVTLLFTSLSTIMCYTLTVSQAKMVAILIHIWKFIIKLSSSFKCLFVIFLFLPL